ncbi:hypothetical protein BD626DRAFT_406811 [Schizophyllum amplum]|uniref:Protein kinase domain-containing protein n=1 Tax=Schizophyllum amplum TaxID=97359 RepID=A0A550C7P9_9AGAR|nr:hypothetical protein BD626DRAFT_406811 [Auriculariopsis ampla]
MNDRHSTQSLSYPYIHLPPPIARILPTQPAADKDNVLDMERNSKTAPNIIQALFGNERFPPACTPNFLVGAVQGVLFDGEKHVWLRYPDSSAPSDSAQRVYAMARFLNDLTYCSWGKYADEILPLPARARQWTVVHSSRVLSNGDTAQVTGVGLSDAYLDVVGWADILCDMQMASKEDDMPDLLERLSAGAANIFMAQEDRLFHVGVALAGNDFQLAYFDRAGRVLSGTYNIHTHVVSFARIIMGLTVLDKSYGGKDTSIVLRDGRRFVTVGGADYEILETLSITRSIRGRGTICWRCRRPTDDEDLVIKNIWATARLCPTEGDLLKEARGIAGIADLVCEETVLGPDGRPRSTVWARDMCAQLYDRSEQELRRLVLRPYARRLQDFSSKEELLRVFRDAIDAHGDLYERRNMLHCDISDNNVMIHQEAGSALRRGILIDLDCAIKVCTVPNEPNQGFTSKRTGTVPFMACEVLWNYPKRGPWHDLESFLYVLMIVCASYSGPSNTPRKDFDIRTSPMGPWFEGNGNRKWRIMHKFDDTDFIAFLDSVIDPYFDDLKTLVCDLRTVIMRTWDPETDELQMASHADVLTIFDRHIRARQAVQSDSPNTQVKTGGSPSIDGDKGLGRPKRKRGGVQPQAPKGAKTRASRARDKAAAASSSEYSDDSQRTLVAHGRPAKKAKTVADAENVVGWERSPDTGRLIRCWRRRKVDHLA